MRSGGTIDHQQYTLREVIRTVKVREVTRPVINLEEVKRPRMKEVSRKKQQFCMRFLFIFEPKRKLQHRAKKVH